MYFAYGWPKVAFTDLQSGDTYIYLKATEDFLFAVSRTCVQLWTGGLNRLKLSECVRTEEDVKQEGVHMTALWCKAKSTLAVLTSENYLLLYAIHAWKENLVHHSCNTILRDIQKVDIYLSSSIRMDSVSRALSIAGDSRLLLVGFADGTVASLSWSGKMKEVAYPLDDVIDTMGFDAGADTQPSSGIAGASPSASLNATPDSASNISAFAAAAASPALHNISHSYSGLSQSRAIIQMSYCEHSKQVVMVLSDGACAVCGTSEGGLSPLSELCFGRWLCGPQHQAVYAQVGARAQLIAVGRESGEVELYRLHRTAVGSPGPGPGSFGSGPNGLGASSWEPPVRTLSLENWGHKVQQTGAVVQVEWSPDGRALAVAYSGQGVVVWSPSGCRLMCSLRQPPPSLSAFPSTASRAISHQISSVSRSTQATGNSVRGLAASAAQQPPGPAPHVPMDGGISALSWGPMGYQLSLAEVGGGLGIGAGSGGALLELTFAHSLAAHHRVARGGLGTSTIDEEMHVLLAHDRLLLIREAGEMAWGGVPWAAGDCTEPPTGQVGDLTVSHLPLPHSYVVSNWPLQRAAISASGSDIAVAGRSGLAVYNRTTERWRLFGDISQERQVSCRALGWLGAGVLVACSGPDPYASPPPPPAAGSLIVGGAPPAPGGPTGNELLLLPRYHLDLTSLLARHPLQQPPIAMDCLGNHILLASEPLEITLLEVTLHGELSPTGNPRATITTLREISMFDVGRHLSDVALVPLMPLPVGTTTSGATATSNGAISTSATSSAAPKQCVLLRWGGLLSVLDLEKGAEMTLATEIEAFWLSDAITCHTGVGSPSSGGVWAGSGSWPSPPWASSTRESLEGGPPFTTQMASTGPMRLPSRLGEGSLGGAAAAAPVLSAVVANALSPAVEAPAAAAGAAPGGGARFVEGQAAGGGGRGTAAGEVSGGGVATGKEAAGISGTTGAGEEEPSSDPFERAGVGAAASGMSPGAAPPPAAATLDVEMPWWLYGPAGMQLCFPSSLGTPMSPSMGFREGHDIELEFDQEVYPVGISLADDAIVGITQRIVRGPPGLLVPGSYQLASASQLPCFHPIPESQPVLPCLLRRLLQRGAFHEAVSLARRHARGPHFARSLEWLLFTALEIDTNTSSLARPVPSPSTTTSVPGGSRRLSGVPPGLTGPSDSGEGMPRDSSFSKQLNQQSLLSAAADLVRYFPTLFAEVVVSVARKTDAALWPPLFDAVGSPSKLLDGLVEAGELASAACFLLIIDRLEGAHAAQAQALRLMRSSLLRGQYPLCCELLRFVVPPSDQDTDGGRGLGTEISFSQGVGDEATASGAVAKAEAAGLGRQPVGADTQQPSAAPPQPSTSTPAQESSESQEASAAPEPTTGRSWLGWLLGYSADPVPAPVEDEPEVSERDAATAQAATALTPPADAGDASSSSRVQQTLAVLGIESAGGTLANVSAGLSDANGRSPVPGSPGRGSLTAAAGSGTASGSPSSAQLLLGGVTAGGSGAANSAASAKACRLVAEHAWQLLEAGHVAALGQLVQASNFMPGGLAGLMNQYRDSPYALHGCASFTALELLSALAVAVTELPVWNSEEVEMCAVGVEALCREVGAVAWAVAMAVLLVDVGTVTAFRHEQPEVWAQFTSMLQADPSFSYLWDIVEVLSGEGGDRATPLGSAGGRAETDRQEGDVGVAGTAITGEGSFAPSVSAGHVELRSQAARSKGEAGQQQGAPVESGGLATSIPGPVAGEVSIARG